MFNEINKAIIIATFSFNESDVIQTMAPNYGKVLPETKKHFVLT